MEFHTVVHTLGSYSSFFNFWSFVLFFRLTKSWKFSCNFSIQITCTLVHGCSVPHSNYSFFHSTNFEYFQLSWDAIGICFSRILIYLFEVPQTMFLFDVILKFMSLTFILLYVQCALHVNFFWVGLGIYKRWLKAGY